VWSRVSAGGAIAWPVSFSGATGLVYDRGMPEVTAFVLAGGQSSRMRTEKAFVEFNGQTLLARALQVVTSITPQVRIVGSKVKFAAFGEVVEDEFLNRGPLGGIHAALRASDTELNLILAVDMAFVEKRFLRYLVGEAQSHDAVVTVPRAGGNWQPLCAMYRKPFAVLAEAALLKGRNKIDLLFQETTVHVLAQDALEREGFSRDIFRNLNTPEDLQDAQMSSSKGLCPTKH
jgi:molybdenum cofactor guanylyltransferase